MFLLATVFLRNVSREPPAIVLPLSMPCRYLSAVPSILHFRTEITINSQKEIPGSEPVHTVLAVVVFRGLLANSSS